MKLMKKKPKSKFTEKSSKIKMGRKPKLKFTWKSSKIKQIGKKFKFNNLKKRKISETFIYVIALILFFITINSVANFINFARGSNNINAISKEMSYRYEYLDLIKSNLVNISLAADEIAQATEGHIVEYPKANIRTLTERYDSIVEAEANINSLLENLNGGSGYNDLISKEDLDTLSSAVNKYISTVHNLVKNGVNRNLVSGKFKTLRATYSYAIQISDSLIEESKADINNLLGNIKTSNSVSLVLICVLYIITIVFSALACVYLLSIIRSDTVKIKQVLEIMSDGDLSNNIDNDSKSKNEFETIKKLLSVLNSNVKSSLVGIKNSFNKFKDENNEIIKSINHINKSIGEVNQSLNNISSGTEEQNDNIASISKNIHEFDVILNENKSEISLINKESLLAGEKIKSTNEQLGTLVENFNSLSDLIATLSRQAISLTGDIKKVNGIAESIKDIADKTNLLALNANIESARVGVQGLAFGVIAEEIGSLAKQTKESSGNISSILLGIDKESAVTRAMASKTEIELNSSSEVIKRTVSEMATLLTNIESTISKFSNIDKKNELIIDKSEDILNNIQELLVISDSNSGHLEEITAYMQNIGSFAETVSDKCTQTVGSSVDVLDRINKFKFNND